MKKSLVFFTSLLITHVSAATYHYNGCYKVIAKIGKAPQQIYASEYGVVGYCIYNNNLVIFPTNPRTGERIYAECDPITSSSITSRYPGPESLEVSQRTARDTETVFYMKEIVRAGKGDGPDSIQTAQVLAYHGIYRVQRMTTAESGAFAQEFQLVCGK